MTTPMTSSAPYNVQILIDIGSQWRGALKENDQIKTVNGF